MEDDIVITGPNNRTHHGTSNGDLWLDEVVLGELPLHFFVSVENNSYG